MATHDNGSSNALAELLDEQAHLSLNELARACCMQPDWVAERLAAGPCCTANTPAAAGISAPPPWCARAAWPIWKPLSTPTPNSPGSPPT